MSKFKKGNQVKWSSQAGGGTTEKIGTVVHVLSRKGPAPFETVAAIFPNHRRMFDGLRIPGNAEEGYLVEVRISDRAKPRLYMPYPSKLKPA